VYVLTNESMPGLIKVGYTTRTVRKRIDELAHTGHPTRFVSELEIDAESADLLEQSLHRALGRFHYQKEFFKCDVRVAVEVVKSHLERTDVTIYDISGRARDLFLTEDEKLRIDENQRRLEREAEEHARQLQVITLQIRQREKYLRERESFYLKEYRTAARRFSEAIKWSIPMVNRIWDSGPTFIVRVVIFFVSYGTSALAEIAIRRMSFRGTPYELGRHRRAAVDKVWLDACDRYCALRRQIVDEDKEIFERLYRRYRSDNTSEVGEGQDLDVGSEYAEGLMGWRR